MAIDLTGLAHLMIMGLSEHVFGSVALACTMIMLIIVIIALLIRIPVPFAVAIPIPLAIVFAAYGYLTVLWAGVLSAIFLVLAVGSFFAGLGTR